MFIHTYNIYRESVHIFLHSFSFYKYINYLSFFFLKNIKSFLIFLNSNISPMNIFVPIFLRICVSVALDSPNSEILWSQCKGFFNMTRFCQITPSCSHTLIFSPRVLSFHHFILSSLLEIVELHNCV